MLRGIGVGLLGTESEDEDEEGAGSGDALGEYSEPGSSERYGNSLASSGLLARGIGETLRGPIGRRSDCLDTGREGSGDVNSGRGVVDR